MSFDPKFVELTADVLEIYLFKMNLKNGTSTAEGQTVKSSEYSGY